jgi:hypothetical protein
LKNQVNEKEELCLKLEAEVVDIRKKAEKSNKFLNSYITHDFGHHDGVLMMVYSGSS